MKTEEINITLKEISVKTEEINIKIKGKEVRVPFEIFGEGGILCEECYYPMSLWKGYLSCRSCNIFKKNKEITGGVKYFIKNVSIGPYYDKEVKTNFSATKKNLSELILLAKKDEEMLENCVRIICKYFFTRLPEYKGRERECIICSVPDEDKDIQKGLILSENCGKELGIESRRLLLKTDGIKKQHNCRNLDERFDNAKDAFCINEKEKESVRGKIIILLDDIMSSMATQNKCAEILIANGARGVISFTIGRHILVDKEGDDDGNL